MLCKALDYTCRRNIYITYILTIVPHIKLTPDYYICDERKYTSLVGTDIVPPVHTNKLWKSFILLKLFSALQFRLAGSHFTNI